MKSIELEECKWTEGGSLLLKQEDNQIVVTSRKNAQKLIDELRASVDTFWNDDPWPVDSSIGKSGAEWAFERGD